MEEKIKNITVDNFVVKTALLRYFEAEGYHPTGAEDIYHNDNGKWTIPVKTWDGYTHKISLDRDTRCGRCGGTGQEPLYD